VETNKHYRAISGILIALLLIISSCSISNKAAITCSEFYYNKNTKSPFVNTRIKSRFPSKGRIIGKKQHTGSSRKIQGKKRVVLNNSSPDTAVNIHSCLLADLFSNDLYQYTFTSFPVKLTIENLFPGAKVQPAC
jgi:hypothetical protein